MAQPQQPNLDVVPLSREAERWQRVLYGLCGHYDAQVARAEREFLAEGTTIRASVLHRRQEQIAKLDGDFHQYMHSVRLGIESLLDEFETAELHRLGASYKNHLTELAEMRDRDILKHLDKHPVQGRIQPANEPEPPEEVEGETEWEVECVLASRVWGEADELQYQVAWRGCDPDKTWYPAGNFKNAATMLDTFHSEHPDAAGPPLRLQQWITDAADDRFSKDHVDDSRVKYKAGATRT